MTGKQKATGGKRQAAAAMALVDASSATRAAAADTVVVTLPADCRIAAQVALKDALIGAMAAGTVKLDASEVQHTDTAALQLLVLFQREMKARGGTWGWRGTSDALNHAAGLLGLSQTMELPAAALAR